MDAVEKASADASAGIEPPDVQRNQHQHKLLTEPADINTSLNVHSGPV